MKGPLDAIESHIDQIKLDVERRVQIALLRETVRVSLSRLTTLDPDRADRYLSAIASME